MKVRTMRCVECGQPGELELSQEDVNTLTDNAGHIQDTLPHLSAAVREQLMTGTHPKCWDEMMSEPEY
jgi:hypothetical protein